MGNARKIKKIWLALGTPFQVNFFAPLLNRLRDDYEFLVTARSHDTIFQILDAKGIEYIPLGRHGGKNIDGKLLAYADNIKEMVPLIKKEKPDLLLTERWPEAVRVAFGFNIPSWAIFFDERETHVNQMVFPLVSKIFSPRFYDIRDLYRGGVTDAERVVWFNGFHTSYLKGNGRSNTLDNNNGSPHKKKVLIRPEPEFATFFHQEKPILDNAVRVLLKRRGKELDFELNLFPRSESQAKRYSKMGVPSMSYSTNECPVADVDVALGAAETMLMEALVLCKPAVSSIYWTPSKPVLELHKYIPHSTDSEQIANYVIKYLDPEENRLFYQKAKLLVDSMDNPIDVIVGEIVRLNAGSSVMPTRNKRRSKMEILMDIVQATAFRPVRISQIMKNANISYSELRSMMDKLESRQLIRGEDSYDGRFYQITEIGMTLLHDYRKLRSQVMDAENITLEKLT